MGWISQFYCLEENILPSLGFQAASCWGVEVVFKESVGCHQLKASDPGGTGPRGEGYGFGWIWSFLKNVFEI